jgi:uncharacterized protein
MGLSEQIHSDMIAAMKAKSELRLSTLRMMKTAVKNREIDQRKPLEDSEVHQVLGTMIKQREDSAAQFMAGGREELAAKEKAEIAIIESYLPRAASMEDVENAVKAAIAESGASGAKDMGKAMKAAMAKFQGQRVDGKMVSEAVKRQLG